MMLQYLQVQEGLAAGRRWLWDEAARKIGILLSAPSAFEGEHFQQVSCLNFSLPLHGYAQCCSCVAVQCHLGCAGCRCGPLLVSPPGICYMTSGADLQSCGKLKHRELECF